MWAMWLQVLFRKARRKIVAIVVLIPMVPAQDPSPGTPIFSLITRTLGLRTDSGLTTELVAVTSRAVTHQLAVFIKIPVGCFSQM